MDVIKNWIKYVNYPLAMGITRNSERLHFYKNCIEKQYRPLKQNLEERDEALFDILDYAIKNVPYYREVAKERNIHLSKENIIEDLKKFPILTKEIIRKEGSRLYSTEKIKYSISTSGGSTGEPVKLRHDINLKKRYPGQYFLSYAGYDIGDKIALLWGSEKDIFQGTIGIRSKISNYFIHRRCFLNSFMMTEDDMRNYIQIINRRKPKVILAYVQSIYELSQFIRKNQLDIYSPAGIVVSAGTLFPDWKKEIQTVFKCPIINQYGSRETPGIAISCIESDKLHINLFINHVEVVDEEGKTLPYDIDGNILVTNLLNRSMPLIRYKIGDIGSLSSEMTCQCGRNLPRLNHIKGRTVNIFKKKDGTRVDGEYFTHLFYGVESIKRFQVLQHDYEEIEILIELVQNKTIDKLVMNDIKKKIKLVMGENCEISFKFVDEIMPSKSGKYLYTISMIPQEN